MFDEHELHIEHDRVSLKFRRQMSNNLHDIEIIHHDELKIFFNLIRCCSIDFAC
jgi:hypothetical protein